MGWLRLVAITAQGWTPVAHQREDGRWLWDLPTWDASALQEGRAAGDYLMAQRREADGRIVLLARMVRRGKHSHTSARTPSLNPAS